MNAVNILQWEFEYARTTASEAMRDRHTMGNYYLVAVGIVASAVVALLNPTSGLPAVAGALVLAVLCIIGCFYFANIIRLRQAWRGSAEAMNRIKRFCIENQLDFNSQKLECAFMWKADTLPRAAKRWTVFQRSGQLVCKRN